jgi:hypothetical protein
MRVERRTRRIKTKKVHAGYLMGDRGIEVARRELGDRWLLIASFDHQIPLRVGLVSGVSMSAAGSIHHPRWSNVVRGGEHDWQGEGTAGTVRSRKSSIRRS